MSYKEIMMKNRNASTVITLNLTVTAFQRILIEKILDKDVVVTVNFLSQKFFVKKNTEEGKQCFNYRKIGYFRRNCRSLPNR